MQGCLGLYARHAQRLLTADRLFPTADRCRSRPANPIWPNFRSQPRSTALRRASDPVGPGALHATARHLDAARAGAAPAHLPRPHHDLSAPRDATD